MKVKAVVDFALQFGVKISFNEDLIIQQDGRYFLLNNTLKPLVKQDSFYAGAFLGKVKEGKFFPSFILLSMLAQEHANKVMVEGKAAWLFICGRDILGKSIVRVYGSGKKNTNTLVLNELGECLGFGRIVENLSGSTRNNQIAVRNVSDLGDFLRRER